MALSILNAVLCSNLHVAIWTMSRIAPSMQAAVRFHVPNVDTPRGIILKEKLPETDGFDAEVVQSLAKWKRIMLQWWVSHSDHCHRL